jgi:hypothetical protein
MNHVFIQTSIVFVLVGTKPPSAVWCLLVSTRHEKHLLARLLPLAATTWHITQPQCTNVPNGLSPHSPFVKWGMAPRYQPPTRVLGAASAVPPPENLDGNQRTSRIGDNVLDTSRRPARAGCRRLWRAACTAPACAACSMLCYGPNSTDLVAKPAHRLTKPSLFRSQLQLTAALNLTATKRR